MGQCCIICCLNRRLIGTEPVTKQYDIQSLECPSCRSVVRLVQRRAEQVRHRRRVSANSYAARRNDISA
jgi:hypothetical protein